MQKAFDGVPGVVEVTAGYAGGSQANPDYELVETGKTGYAESVQVIYEPSRLSYDGLLDIYWHHIDPTTVNRAFSDTGPQYRSIIFFRDSAQQRAAEASKQALDRSHRFKTPVVTEIQRATKFYPAEEYHQQFYKKNPERYRAYVIGCGREERRKELWGNEKQARVTSHESRGDDLSGSSDASTHDSRLASLDSGKRTQPGGWQPVTFNKPSDAELKQKLSSEQYQVTQHEGTEPAVQQRLLGQPRGRASTWTSSPASRCSARSTSSTQAPAGPASPVRWSRRTFRPRPTSSSSPSGPRCDRSTPTRTWAICSMTVPRRPVSATA